MQADPVNLAWHPEYDYPLGEPDGPAVKTGTLYRRTFSSEKGSTVVSFNTTSNLGTIKWAAGEASGAKAAVCRERFAQPFASTSIWNVAIGSSAVFAPAALYTPSSRLPTQFHNDQEFVVRATLDLPLTPWIHQGDWSGDDHCKVTGQEVARLRLPAAWTTASDGGRSAAGQPNNNGMGVLLEDNE